MERFYVRDKDDRYGKINREMTMIVVSEDDIKNGNFPVGYGVDILVLPKSYENSINDIKNIEYILPIIYSRRNGKIIFV